MGSPGYIHTNPPVFMSTNRLKRARKMAGKGESFISWNSPLFFRFIPVLLLFVFWAAPALGWDRPFDLSANWGGTGLMEIPTARVLEDGELRFGAAQALPYRWYTAALGVFPGLEFGGRFTEFTNVPTNLNGYGNYKDKAFDLKYQLVPESRKWPAVAMGLHDFHGTQLFEAQYLALSRQVFPFDLTIGIGRGRLRGPLRFPVFDQFGLFGGIEWALHRRCHLMAEFNPVQYQNDTGPPARALHKKAKWPVNLGVRLRLLAGVDLGVSFQRGDTLGLGLHFQTKLGRPVRPQKADPPLRHAVDRRPFEKRDLQEMVESIYDAVKKAGFRDILVYTGGRDVTAEFENSRYLSEQKAAGRVLRILLYYSPREARKLVVRLRRLRMPLLEVSVCPDHLEKYLMGEIPGDIFGKLVTVRAAPRGSNGKDAAQAFVRHERLDVSLGVKPDFETYLNDPSGVFKCRPGIKPYAEVTPWKGGSLFARYDIPLYSNIRSSNTPPPDAVRSDSWLYSDRDYTFDHLMVDQNFRIFDNTFVRFSAGYLEQMYAGAGGEILAFFRGGNLGLGLEGDWVRKRTPGARFDLTDFRAHSLLGNLYYRVPGIGVTLQAQYGRFLAGDRGCEFFLTREYETGARFGFWYSMTDTSGLTGFNRGYHDKGVFLSLPARMFMDHDSPVRYNYAVSPWTRDVAAAVFHWRNLFGLTDGLGPSAFREHLERVKK